MVVLEPVAVAYSCTFFPVCAVQFSLASLHTAWPMDRGAVMGQVTRIRCSWIPLPLDTVSDELNKDHYIRSAVCKFRERSAGGLKPSLGGICFIDGIRLVQH